MRRVLFLTGTRADYGLMRRTLKAIERDDRLSLGLIVTGMHLDSRYGITVTEIEDDGFRIAGRIPVDFAEGGEGFMARGIARIIEGCCDILDRERPDLLLLLGDRGEMLAGAIAAVHLNIPVAHIHGGERSGTIDEPVRHAISKLAHVHLTATQASADRLIRMGELPSGVFCVGAPGLDGLREAAVASREECLRAADLEEGPVALMVFHPVVQAAAEGPDQARAILSTLREDGYRIVALMPNADLGGEPIRRVLEEQQEAGDIRVFTHLPRNRFVSWMAAADVMIGNSSAGIIEAASFGTPVINVGARQNLRERNANVIDTAAEPAALRQALSVVRARGKFAVDNVYGDGATAQRIADLLAELVLDRSLMEKFCAY